MDNIRQAVERARQLNSGGAGQKDRVGSISPVVQFDTNAGISDSIDRHGQASGQDLALELRHLDSNRIVSHDDTDFRSKSFDMLRTQVLQSMDQKNWKVLGVTSPSSACGKTVTAINLAFSIARQPERSGLLVDLDLQNPQIASYLGLDCASGLVSVLEGRTSLPSAIIRARAGDISIMVLPAETSASNSSAWMTSRAMTTMLQEIKRDYRSQTVILDLPPMLSSDDVIAVLPQLDCVLLVAAVGRSTVAEIDECNKHLQSAAVVRLVLNKVPQSNARHYPYYAAKPRSF